jgi:NAD(P)-dependent dehydrogenase (short-subunit alcohol dehydrogenase family)
VSEAVRSPAAVVTGAASGMGAASARKLASEGWQVQLLDVSDKVMAVGEEIRAAGGTAISARVDVSQRVHVAAAISAARTEFGRIDGLVNCAGIEQQPARFADMTEADLDRVFAVNVKGVIFAMQEVLPAMLEQGSGSIVNISSGSALMGIPRLGAYTASKAAVLGLSRSAAVEYARKGIRVNAICPGIIRTGMFENTTVFDPAAIERTGGGAPAGRIGEPEEIADAVWYLISPASRFVTGTAFVVDGGMSAQ